MWEQTVSTACFSRFYFVDLHLCANTLSQPYVYLAPYLSTLTRPFVVLSEFDLRALRTGVMAGSPCPIEVMKRLISDMNLREMTICYGMTETSPVSTQVHAAGVRWDAWGFTTDHE
jgi:acyl-CoA synthetase (AMP-forming)/AMP-acid ligase II